MERIELAPCVSPGCGHGADRHIVDREDDERPFPCEVAGCDCSDYVDEPLRKKP